MSYSQRSSKNTTSDRRLCALWFYSIPQENLYQRQGAVQVLVRARQQAIREGFLKKEIVAPTRDNLCMASERGEGIGMEKMERK